MKFTTFFFTLLLLSPLSLVQAQKNINELIEAATELATEANKQLAAGDYEAAAENFEKAAKKFEAAGMPAQANTEWINAGAAYDNAANDESGKGNHAEAADLYNKAAQASDKAGMKGQANSSKRNRNASLRMLTVQNAVGTGHSTGHIATIHIQNKGNFPLILIPQTFFIPSDGIYQSYVGSTPSGITITPGQTTQIPVHGYCVDIHTPPVSSSVPMPSLNRWIPVISTLDHEPPSINPVSLESAIDLKFGASPMPAFDSTQISTILNSAGFSKATTAIETAFIATWPGTEIAIGGAIDVNKEPATVAPLIVDIVSRIQATTIGIKANPPLNRPLTSDELRKAESIAQQAIWISMSILTGQEYTKDDFAENVYQQYEEHAHHSVNALSNEDQEKIDTGINDFWDSFTLTGIESKVIKENNHKVEGDLLGVDIEDAQKKSDLPKLRRPQYERYVAARAINGKTHKEACKECSLKGVDPDGKLGKAFKRIYDNETN